MTLPQQHRYLPMPFRAKPVVGEIAKVVLRYALAFTVAYFVSIMATLVLGVLTIAPFPESPASGVRLQHLHQVLFIQFAFVGCAGVLAGSFCLGRCSRRLGSIVLLAVGLGYYAWLWRYLNTMRPEYHEHEFPHLPALAVGGMVAVLALWLWRPTNKVTVPTGGPATQVANPEATVRPPSVS